MFPVFLQVHAVHQRALQSYSGVHPMLTMIQMGQAQFHMRLQLQCYTGLTKVAKISWD